MSANHQRLSQLAVYILCDDSTGCDDADADGDDTTKATNTVKDTVYKVDLDEKFVEKKFIHNICSKSSWA